MTKQELEDQGNTTRQIVEELWRMVDRKSKINIGGDEIYITELLRVLLDYMGVTVVSQPSIRLKKEKGN